MDSILTSIKKMLGISEEYEQFDPELMIYINSAFGTLKQLGVGPDSGYSISSKDNTWGEFSSDASEVSLVKSYVYISVRLIFDPPTSSFVLDSLSRQRDEIGWRLNAGAELESI